MDKLTLKKLRFKAFYKFHKGEPQQGKPFEAGLIFSPGLQVGVALRKLSPLPYTETAYSETPISCQRSL